MLVGGWAPNTSRVAKIKQPVTGWMNRAAQAIESKGGAFHFSIG